MSVSNSIHNAEGDDRANLFDFMAPLQSNDHYFSTANLTTPAFADVSANSDAILSRPPADSNQQPSLERAPEENPAPVPAKRKHSDVEKDRRRSISNGFAALQSTLHNNPDAKPISKTILLQQACDEIRELRKKLEAATTITSPFGLENLFHPTPLGQQSSPPNPASRTYSPNTPGLYPDAFRDSRRSSTATSTTGTLYNVSFSDHQREERRRPYSKRTNSHSSESEGSDDDSINTASSSCGNMSDSEGSDSESEPERGAGYRSKVKDKSGKAKAKERKEERNRTGSRHKTKAFSNRSSPFSTSAPSVVSPPLSYSPNRDIQQAILSLLLELPSHLEEVKKQRRLHPLPHHPETEEPGDETLTKTKPPKRRYR